jgi:hypothetical protein
VQELKLSNELARADEYFIIVVMHDFSIPAVASLKLDLDFAKCVVLIAVCRGRNRDPGPPIQTPH